MFTTEEISKIENFPFMEEIWKYIDSGEGYYQVSNMGRVRSLDREIAVIKFGKQIKRLYKGKILSVSLNRYGYYRLTMYNNGVYKNHTVHRLVAMAFLANPNNFKEINHKWGIKTDNRVSELEWCDSSYNKHHSYDVLHRSLPKNLLIGTSESHPAAVKVVQYSLIGEFIKEWGCMKDSANKYGVSPSGIGACCRGLQPTAAGYIWKYKSKECIKL